MQWANAGRIANSPDGTCECGVGNREGACGALRDTLLARDFEQPVAYWRYHRLAVDAYCLQHAAYVKSAKSFAAHIGGLCIAFEYGNDLSLHELFIRWLNASGRQISKPSMPNSRGGLTIAHVSGIDDPVVYGRLVGEWAAAVWSAYSSCHAVALGWVEETRMFQRVQR
jgi:hypothetical protein